MPHLSSLSAAAALAVLSGSAPGQIVEFRIIERTGQTIIQPDGGSNPTTDNILNFAVQARVTGGSPTQFLGSFQFNLRDNGELETFGTLNRLRISNTDGTYDENLGQSVNNSVGRGGVAAIYSYLAGISADFNGLINISAGSFTHAPGNQEIGLVAGSATGSSLLLLTDPAHTGNPSTYPGTGTTAPIDPAIAANYLGAGGNFVDIYRFQYTVTDLQSDRPIGFAMSNITATVGSGLVLANGVWQPVQTNITIAVVGSAQIHIVPAPASGAAMMLGVLGVGGVGGVGGAGWRRRRTRA